MSDYTPDPTSAWLSGLGKKRFDAPNQYSSYPEGTKYSLPTYVGPATNAMGTVNQSYQAPQTHTTTVPGTTINSGGGYSAGNPYNLPTTPFALEAMLGSGTGFGQSAFAKNALQTEYNRGGGVGVAPEDWSKWGGGGQTTTTPDVTTTTTDPNRDNYLSSMAHPDAPPTFGANVPQAPLPSQGKSVLDTFLAAHQASPAPSGGGYDNSGFFDTLSKLRGSGSDSGKVA